jgi:hypothetical protein
MKLRIVTVLVALVAFVALAQYPRPQRRSLNPPIIEAPIDPSVPAAEAKLIRDLQLRAAALERRVQELEDVTKPRVAPVSQISK